MTLLEAGVLAAVVAMGTVWLGLNRESLLAAASFLSLFAVFAVVWGSSPEDALRVGISGADPWITTTTIGMLLAIGVQRLLFAGARTGGSDFRYFLYLSSYLLTAYIFAWPHTGEVRSGCVHMATAALAWGVGLRLGRRVRSEGLFADVAAGWIVVVVVLQALVACLQASGMNVFLDTGVVIEDLGLQGRSSGTLGHPSSVGKASFLLAVSCVALMGATTRIGRKRLVLALAILTVPLTLSGGRANMLGYIILVLVVLALLESRQRWSVRLIAVYACFLGVFFSREAWQLRFQNGENGYYRDLFEAGALRYLGDPRADWVFGAGANSYVSAVGPVDSWAASGWIVHNFALLALVEVGILGLGLLLVPFFLTFFRGIQACLSTRRGPRTLADIALVGGPLGALPILLTGWGMMSTMLAPTFFTLGFSLALQRRVASTSLDLGVTAPIEKSLR